MSILHEGLRAGNAMMVVPSSALDTMNLGGLTGLASAGAAAASHSSPPEPPPHPAAPRS